MSKQETTIRTYTVTGTHPRLTGPVVVDLIATTPKAAIARVRGSMFHSYRDMWPYEPDAKWTAEDIGDASVFSDLIAEDRDRERDA